MAGRRCEVCVISVLRTVTLSACLAACGTASAEEGGFFDFLSGDWYLNVGAAPYVAPRFEGSDSYLLRIAPIVSLGKAGKTTPFSSRNDNISFALMDKGTFRAGVVGKLLFERNDNDAPQLKGLDRVPFGGELGAFAEYYPTGWMRVRGEVRQGIEAHTGVVADLAVDAFHDLTPTIRVSGGPRVSFASQDYFQAYYGVTPSEAAASGLSEYDPGGGLRAVGVGGAVNWQATDRIAASLFGEYARLTGPAANSSLVKERGSPNQFMVGISTTYRFDFTVP
ncbi:MAG: MipA/OmpV family protein [Rhizobiaceae bacterium]|nr:MipA/OmpV family protein [Rhizobiaceae bacterium]